jgi:hypothetical protein
MQLLFYPIKQFKGVAADGALSMNIKQQLLTASSQAIRVESHYPGPYISYLDLHRHIKRATPTMNRKCILSL